ncbi:MAG: DUF192 domain-containing protein [Candidatus Schekmanbacteria bacterium]|nr:DUF192 domain-containing protein [Candidatus Schekmanbacteria bacterium]
MATLNGAPLCLEIAATIAERQRGLMNRAALAAEHGMLFVFPTETTTGFWMKDTHIPLDIAFLDASRRVAEVLHLTPYSLETRAPRAAFRYALELNEGWFARHGLGPGSILSVDLRHVAAR